MEQELSPISPSISKKDVSLHLELKQFTPRISQQEAPRKMSTGNNSSRSVTATEESDTSTNTKKKREITSYLLDVPVVVMALLVIVLGVICGLILFVILLQTEYVQINELLDQNVQELYKSFQTGVFNLERQLAAAQFFMMDNEDPRQVSFERFLRFVDNSKLVSDGIITMEFVQRVTNGSDKTNFEQELKSTFSSTAFPHDYHVYDAIDTNTGIWNFSLADRDSYFPIKYVVPLDSQSFQRIGYALDGEARRRRALYTSLQIHSMTSTEKLILRQNETQEVFFTFVPVFNFSNPSQEVFGLIKASVLASSILVRLSNQFTEVKVIDINAAKEDSLLASTVTNFDNVYRRDMNTTVGNRIWSITFFASNILITKVSISSYGKWIALFIPIIIAFVIFGVIISFLIIKRMHWNRSQQNLLKEKLAIQREGKEKLDAMINNISLEEAKSRFLLSAIPYPIFTMDANGYIKLVNEAFQDTFYVPNLQTAVLTQVLPMFETVDQFDTWYNSITDAALPSLELADKFGRPKTYNVIVSKQMLQQVKRKEELIIVVLQHGHFQDLISKYKLPKDSSQQQTGISMLKQIIGDSALFEKFKKHCSEERNEESVLFLEDVIKYKQKQKVSSRIEFQQTIKERYLVAGAPKELNLNRKLLDQKLEMQTGRLDDFDELELLVMNILSQDPLKRFLHTLNQQL